MRRTENKTRKDKKRHHHFQQFSKEKTNCMKAIVPSSAVVHPAIGRQRWEDDRDYQEQAQA